MNKRLKQLCEETDQCAKKHHASNRVKCLKEKIKNEIGVDKDLLLAYKISCSKNSSLELAAFALTAATLILTPLMSEITNKTFVWIVIAILLVGTFTIWVVIETGKNHEILMILEQIEEEMREEK